LLLLLGNHVSILTEYGLQGLVAKVSSAKSQLVFQVLYARELAKRDNFQLVIDQVCLLWVEGGLE